MSTLSQPPSPPPSISLRISLGGVDPPLSLSLPPTSTISQLRSKIFATVPTISPHTHRLRLISAGKLLLSTHTLTSANLTDNSYLHCAISEITTFPANTSPPTKPSHPDSTSPSSPSDRNPSAETRILLPASTQSVASLRAAGLSDEQIIAVRFPFLFEEVTPPANSDDVNPALTVGTLGVDLDELERNEREAELELEGPWNDCLWGFLLGAMLGLIMLVLSMDRSIVLSRRWKRGISLGALVNIVFGVVMLTNDK